MLAPSTVARRIAGALVLLFIMALPAIAVPAVTGTAAQPTVAASPPAATKPIAIPPVKWFVNGYVQGRFEDVLGETTTANTFEIKRAYINVLAKVNEHIAGGIMVGGIPSTKVYEAFGEYTVDPSLKGRLGLYRLPFGYELQLSSSRLITLERSQVITSLLYKDFNFDRGLYAYYTPVGKPFTVSAGVTNGSFLDTQIDENENKNFVGRVGYNLLGGQIGASIYRGTSPNGLTMNRTGVDLQITRGPLLIQGEAAEGQGRMSTDPIPVFVDAKSRGAYLTLAYQKSGSPRQPYLRLDTYDPDIDSTNDNFRRATVGYNYYLTGNTRLTLEYQAIQDELRPNVDGNIGAQYQVSF